MQYGSGKHNPADYISRHPSDVYPGSQESYTELYVHFIAKHTIPNAMSRKEIAEETEREHIGKLLKNAISRKRGDDNRMQIFKKLRNEFSITDDGIILRNSRIFLPHKLQRKAVSIAHESHQGVEKTKALLRENVWFPKMHDIVKEALSTCIPCLSTGANVRPEPITMTKMPDKPWTKLHIDFKGP